MVEYITHIIMEIIDKDKLDSNSDNKTIDSYKVRNFGHQLAERCERIAVMMEILAVHGFTFTATIESVIAKSTTVEAQDAKLYLLQKGFRDGEFQVYLEYTRKWGML